MGLTEYVGLTAEEIRQAFDQVMDFCLGLRPDFAAGVLPWSQSGAGHFADVRRLFLLNLRVLANQKVSLSKLTSKIKDLRGEKKNKVSWEEIQVLLSENLGFWNTVSLSKEDEQALKECYLKTFSGKEVDMVKNLYSEDEPLAKLAIRIINQLAKVSWASGGHSAGVVPVYAVGVGADRFNGRLDNTDIPTIIKELAGF